MATLEGVLASDEDSALTIAGADLLANDTDVDNGAVLSVISVPSFSAKGAQLTLVGTDIIYNPTSAPQLQKLAAGETTTDTFNYTISDGNGGFDNAAVTVTVGGVNDAPVANNDAVGTALGPAFYPTNGHFYEIVVPASDNPEWAASKVLAEAAGGYLATITSQAENDFITSLNSGQKLWIGGSDQGASNVWTWRGGPENGENFWNGTFQGSAPAGQYAKLGYEQACARPWRRLHRDPGQRHLDRRKAQRPIRLRIARRPRGRI